MRDRNEREQALWDKMNCPWQPIETAPKDGTAILTYRKPFMAVAEWMPEYNNWCVVDGCDIINVTHWMPLPPSPRPAAPVSGRCG